MNDNVYIGTSGYSYDDWKEIFYPSKMSRKEFLGFYGRYFATIEVNFTYYQMPFPRTIEALIRKSGGNLKFVIKAHQSLTHERVENDEAYKRFQDAIKSQRKLWCIGQIDRDSIALFHANICQSRR